MNLASKIFLFSILLVSACFPKEDPVTPILRLNQEVSIDAGEDKTDIVFYSLENNEIVGTASPTDWDLYITEDAIQLNYLRSMRAAKVDVEWHEQLSTAGLDFQFLTTENPSKMWQLDSNQIYVLDYGVDEAGDSLGKVKIQVERSNGGVTIWYSPVESAFELVETVDDDDFYFNIRNTSTVDLPSVKDYDLVFGKYTDFVIIDLDSLDYPVYGAIMGNASAHDTTMAFEDVEAIDFLQFERNPNDKIAIGWDWKSFNLDKNAYEINADKVYLIETFNGFIYKLRFTNYYNSSGVSGHPTFEFKLL